MLIISYLLFVFCISIILVSGKMSQKYYVFLKYTNNSYCFFFLLKIEYLHAHICIKHQLIIHHIVWGTSTW